jgi:hypothetical protein
MSERHWLWRLTYPEGHHPLGQQPYLFEHDGEIWSAVTNGRVVVFLSGRAGDFEQARPDLAAMLLRYFGPAGKRTGFYLEEVKQFLGQADWPAQCPECAGASPACPRCQGTGELTPAVRLGWFCGVPIDRNLLARALERLTANIVWVYTQGPTDPLFVIAESWRASIAPLFGVSGDPALEGDNPRLGG